MASSCLGDRKQVQNARFDSRLTGVKKESQHPSPQALHTYFKVYSVETKSTVSIHSLM